MKFYVAVSRNNGEIFGSGTPTESLRQALLEAFAMSTEQHSYAVEIGEAKQLPKTISPFDTRIPKLGSDDSKELVACINTIEAWEWKELCP